MGHKWLLCHAIWPGQCSFCIPRIYELSVPAVPPSHCPSHVLPEPDWISSPCCTCVGWAKGIPMAPFLHAIPVHLLLSPKYKECDSRYHLLSLFSWRKTWWSQNNNFLLSFWSVLSSGPWMIESPKPLSLSQLCRAVQVTAHILLSLKVSSLLSTHNPPWALLTQGPIKLSYSFRIGSGGPRWQKTSESSSKDMVWKSIAKMTCATVQYASVFKWFQLKPELYKTVDGKIIVKDGNFLIVKKKTKNIKPGQDCPVERKYLWFWDNWILEESVVWTLSYYTVEHFQ